MKMIFPSFGFPWHFLGPQFKDYLKNIGLGVYQSSTPRRALTR